LKIDLGKLNSMHYKLLRIASRDWRNKIRRVELDKLGRAKPSLWGKYATASLAIKALRDNVPTRIVNHLNQTLYTERRYPETPRILQQLLETYRYSSNREQAKDCV
jgi:hypothetical protein